MQVPDSLNAMNCTQKYISKFVSVFNKKREYVEESKWERERERERKKERERDSAVDEHMYTRRQAERMREAKI